MMSSWGRWWPLVLLCCASALRLAISDNLPQVMSSTVSLAAACVVLCAACCGYLLSKRIPSSRTGRWQGSLAGALLLFGPQVVLMLRPGDLTGSDILLAGSLVPVVVAVALAGRESGHGLRTSMLWPGLAASTALLLLFPEPHVRSMAGAATLFLLPAFTGAGAALLPNSSEEKLFWRPAYVLLVASFVFTLCVFLQHGSVQNFSWIAFGFDLVTISCTLISVERVGATRYSALFVVTPLFLLLYGMVLLRPGWNIRMASGLILLLASAVALLRHKQDDEQKQSFRLLE